MPSFWELIFGSFGLGAIAGLAVLTNTKKPMLMRAVFGSMLSSGLLGTGIVCLMWRWCEGSQSGYMFMVGTAVLVPLVGVKALDLREIVLERVKNILRVLINGNGNGPSDHGSENRRSNNHPSEDSTTDQQPMLCAWGFGKIY